MAKVSAITSVGDAIHTRTTSDATETQAAVLAVDGGDSVVATPQLGTGEFVVAIAGGVYTTTTGTITTTTSTITSGDISRAGNVTVGIYGTYAGVNVSFEVSPDGTNWFPVGMTREDTAINEAVTGVLTANTTRMWTTGCPGFTRLRVRATAWTSGTANVVILPGAMPFEPLTASMMQARAATAMPTAVADGAAANLMVDKFGRQIIAPAPQDLWVQGRVTLTTNASTSLIATGGAGIRTAVKSIAATNTSATATRLDILDGATLLHSFQLPASASAPMVTFDPPIIGTANTAVNAQVSTAVTDIRVMATGFRVV